MTRIAVVDTCVLAAGLMTTDTYSPTARLVDGMLTPAFPFALSIALLAEYRQVLGRASLRQRHGLSAQAVEDLLAALAQHAIVLTPVDRPTAPDKGDQHLWDLLGCHERLCLVTGDKLLLQEGQPPAPIYSPARFLTQSETRRVQEEPRLT